ncbi:MAG: TfoX/Sxy family protein [Candidatus Omnitrophica bacterium]|nr:TfoX/Sxy family protein [Candidatus Omnitrophota bacterium]
MAKEYLEQLSSYMKEAISGRSKNVKLECKHFFSGAAVYANGKICMSWTPAGFAIKLPEELRIILLKQKGTKPLRYFPKGPIKKDYVILSKTILNDVKILRHWIKLCIEHVASLPDPVRKKSSDPGAA